MLSLNQRCLPGIIHTYCSPIGWPQISAASSQYGSHGRIRVKFKDDRPTHPTCNPTKWVWKTRLLLDILEIAVFEFHVPIQKCAADLEPYDPGCWAHPWCKRARLCLKLFKLHVALSSGRQCQDPFL